MQTFTVFLTELSLPHMRCIFVTSSQRIIDHTIITTQILHLDTSIQRLVDTQTLHLDTSLQNLAPSLEDPTRT